MSFLRNSSITHHAASRRPAFLPAIVAAIAAVAVGGVIAAGAAWRAWGPVREAPDVVLQRAWTQALAAGSVTSDGAVAGTVTRRGGTPSPTSPSGFRGAGNSPSGRGGETDTLLDLRAQYHRVRVRGGDGVRSDGTMSAAITLPDATAITAAFASRSIGEQQFLRLTEARAVPADTGSSSNTLPLLIAGLQAVVGGKWVSVDTESVSALTASAVGGKLLAVGAQQKTEQQRERSPALTTALLTIPMFRSVEYIGTERDGGDLLLHYRARVNPEVVRVYLASASSRGIADPAKVASALAVAEERVVPAVEKIAADVWVERRGFALRRVRFPLTVDDVGDGMVIHGTADLRWSGWNVPATIETPTDAVPIADVLAPFIRAAGISTDGAVMPDGDRDGLSDVQERLYGSDPANADTDGDGYTDGAEVENGYSPTGTGRLPVQ